jgi:hypothetical protein
VAQGLTFDITVNLLDWEWVVDLECLHEVLATALLGWISRTSVSRTVGIASHYLTIEFTTTEALPMYRSEIG